MAINNITLGSLLAPGRADESGGALSIGPRKNVVGPQDIFSGPKPDQSPADFEAAIMSLLAPLDLPGHLLFGGKPQREVLRLLGLTSGDKQSAVDKAGTVNFPKTFFPQ